MERKLEGMLLLLQAYSPVIGDTYALGLAALLPSFGVYCKATLHEFAQIWVRNL